MKYIPQQQLPQQQNMQSDPATLEECTTQLNECKKSATEAVTLFNDLKDATLTWADAVGLVHVDSQKCSFTSLHDTPDGLGTAGQIPAVNAAGDKLVWTDPATATQGDDAFAWATEGDTSVIPTTKLGTGTASTTTYLRGDGAWSVLTHPAFTDLTDTPANFGAAGQYVRVNSGRDGLEFVNLAASGGTEEEFRRDLRKCLNGATVLWSNDTTSQPSEF